MSAMLRALPLALALGLPAAAQERVAPESFEAMAEGRTLHFTLDGRPFGAEQYFPGRRSLWRFADGRCQEGRWWSEGERICFAYQPDLVRQCWHLSRRDGGLAAALVENGTETGFVLELDHADEAPLPCPAPDTGT